MAMNLATTKSGHVMQMDTQALRIMCQRRNAIPHEFFVDVMKGKLICRACEGRGDRRLRLAMKHRQPCDCEVPGKCGVCEGTKVMAWGPEDVCNRCHGDGFIIVKEETSLAAAGMLAKYIAPVLKQVEISGTVEIEASRLVERLAAGRARIVTVKSKPTTGTSSARLMEGK